MPTPVPLPCTHAGGTRTCIHTPGAALDASEVTPERLAGLLEGAALVCFDGRLTEAALVLAQAAKAAGACGGGGRAGGRGGGVVGVLC